MRVLNWLVRALIFFTLFAFALNNQQAVQVHGFFGLDWQTRMVFVVLAAFAVGCAVGVVAMLPGWWRRRKRPAAAATPSAAPTPAAGSTVPALPSDFVPESRLREGV